MKYLITFSLLYCQTYIGGYQKTLVGSDTVYVGKEITKCDTIKDQAREFVSKKDLDNYLKKNKKDMVQFNVYQFKGKDITNSFK